MRENPFDLFAIICLIFLSILGVLRKSYKYYPKEKVAASKLSDNNEVSEELKRLRKENNRLKQERDILKKAAAYFASEGL